MTSALQGKTILVGGITGGLGRAISARAARLGANVAGFSRGNSDSDEPNRESPEEFRQTADARSEEDLHRVVGATIDRFGRIDGYVHAVGSIFLKPAHLTSLAEFEEVLRQNLTTAFLALRHLLPGMQKQGGGSIVFVSSTASKIGLASHEAIAAAKAGINGLVMAAAASYASRGIRINAVAPGLIDTPMAAPLLGSEQARAVSARMHPLGRIGKPENVASLICWLLTDDADWTTGQIVASDGGMSSVLPRPRA